MDRFNARLLSAISDVLVETKLKDTREQTELEKIASRLKALSLGTVDDDLSGSPATELNHKSSVGSQRKDLN